MEPLLFAGDFVLVSRIHRALKVGDLVAARHAQFGIIIKRIAEIHSQQGLRLEGENPASLSSEQIGIVGTESLIGKVVFSIKRKKGSSSSVT